MRIQNFEQLASTQERRDTLEIIEAGYAAIDTDAAIKNAVTVEDGVLKVQEEEFRLDSYEHIYIVGCGKVACAAAATLENILKGKVREGAVIGVSDHVCEVVTTYHGTHPLPSAANFAASEHMLQIGEKATERDLVLVIVGGGGSALLCSSQGECDQGVMLYDAFLHTGGTIDELNVVRKHISPLKGGGLAKALYPATVVGLIFSDVAGGDLHTVASGPTYKDDTTIEDARAVLRKYGLGDLSLTETPKEDKYFEKVRNILIVANTVAIDAMRKKAVELGYAPAEPECDPYAPPLEVLAAMEKVAAAGTVVLFGGEPRLAVEDGKKGSGGRNSYMAAAALDVIGDGQVFASFASDGRDNSEAAGALVDVSTKDTITETGMDYREYLSRYDTNSVFKGVDALLMTGVIEANVSDLSILLTKKV